MENNHQPRLAGYTLAYTAQHAVGRLCHTTNAAHQVPLRPFPESHLLPCQPAVGLTASQVLGFVLAFGELTGLPPAQESGELRITEW